MRHALLPSCLVRCILRRTAWLLAVWLVAAPRTISLQAPVATEAVGEDADDPAVWIHPTDVSQSLILGTNKAAAPNGALVVYGLDGKIRQRVAGIDRPNNVDVEGNLAVVTERYKRRVRLFTVSAEGVRELGAAPVFEGESGPAAEPMGVALYKRPQDGAVFVIVGRKSGPRKGYLWQYRIDGARLKKVRAFGHFSGVGEIEAIAVDDALGFVYYADEQCCIRKWRADPDHPEAGREVATFGQHEFAGQREGIAIHQDWIVCADQIPAASRYHVFARRGEQGAAAATLSGPADATDGIEVVSRDLGGRFRHGMLVAMNSRGRNFLLFPWPARIP